MFIIMRREDIVLIKCNFNYTRLDEIIKMKRGEINERKAGI